MRLAVDDCHCRGLQVEKFFCSSIMMDPQPDHVGYFRAKKKSWDMSWSAKSRLSVKTSNSLRKVIRSLDQPARHQGFMPSTSACLKRGLWQ
jgi:hypothetical protein